MKKLTIALSTIALSIVAQSTLAATFNLFQPANGILVGNPSTYITTAATSSNVIALWSGTCNATTFLRGDGSCVAVSAATGDPTASVGLTAVNGVASTLMRSDAAPALSQSIAPTWTGRHTFTGDISNPSVSTTGVQVGLGNARPGTQFIYATPAADNRVWEWSVGNGVDTCFYGSARNDVGNSGTSWLTTCRSGMTVSSINLQSTALQWNGNAVPSVTSSPTWTGAHTFTSTGSHFSGTTAQLGLRATGGAADSGNWIARANNSGHFLLGTATDASPTTITNNAIDITRTGTTVDSIALTATAVTVNGQNVCRADGTGCPVSGGVVSVGGADYVSPVCTSITVGGSCMASYGNGGTGTARTSTATYAPDPVLVLQDLPVGNYQVSGCLNVVYGAGGMRTAIYVNPTENSMVMGIKTPLALQQMTLPGGNEWVITAGGSGTADFCFQGRLTQNGPAVMDWGITWAQASSNAAATTMYIHSYIMATRLN